MTAIRELFSIIRVPPSYLMIKHIKTYFIKFKCSLQKIMLWEFTFRVMNSPDWRETCENSMLYWSLGHGRWCGQERVGHAWGEGTRRAATPRATPRSSVATGLILDTTSAVHCSATIQEMHCWTVTIIIINNNAFVTTMLSGSQQLITMPRWRR